MAEIQLCCECGAPENYTDRQHLLDRALDALEWVHNADQITDRRGVLVDMPQAMERVRAVLREAGRLDAAGVAVSSTAQGENHGRSERDHRDQQLAERARKRMDGAADVADDGGSDRRAAGVAGDVPVGQLDQLSARRMEGAPGAAQTVGPSTAGVAAAPAPQPLRHNKHLCADCTTEHACKNRLDLPRPCWCTNSTQEDQRG